MIITEINSVVFYLLLGADYMEIFTPGWNFNSIYRVEKNGNYVKNFSPGWNIIASGK